MSAGQILRLDVVQTSLPVITVGADAGLGGNMTNAVYSGGGQNVIFQDDAIHAPTSGTTLLPSDLAAGVGVWRGVTSIGNGDSWSAGVTASSPYKGLAFDSNYVSGDIRGTYSALPGSGDLLLKFNSSFTTHNTQPPKWNGDGTSTTAEVSVGPQGTINLKRAFNNNNTSPDKILTFNITGTSGNERRTILNFNEGAGVLAGQTVNVKTGSIGGSALPTRLQGALTLTDGEWSAGNDFTVADTGTFTLAGRTVLNLPTGDNLNPDFIEALGANFTYSGQPMVTFADKNGGPHIFEFDLDRTGAGTMPVFAEFLAHVDYGSDHNTHPVDIGGDGLLLGDGNFITDAGTGGSTPRYAAHNTNGSLPKILPGQPGEITLGFASIIRNNLAIELEVDAPDAILQVGTTDPNRLLTNSGDSSFTPAGIPANQVTFEADVNVKGVDIQSGTGRFNNDLDVQSLHIESGAALTMANNQTATVSGAFGGNGTYGGGNGVVIEGTGSLNPGDSIGTITGNTLLLESGATYNWEVGAPTGTPGTDWDLSVSNSFNIAGTLEFNIIEFGLAQEISTSDSFVVAAADDGDLTGFDPNDVLFSVVADQFNWDISGAALALQDGDGLGFNGQDVLMLSGLSASAQSSAAVPEPASIAIWGLLGLGLASFGYYHTRRKQ